MADKVKMSQFRIILTILIAILALGMGLTGVILKRSEQSEIGSMQVLIGTDNKQLAINISNYFRDVEETAALMFSDSRVCDFMPSGLDDYDRIQGENAIRSRIIDIALMKNFSDFGVVFQDDTDAGWISQVTSSLFPEGGIYDTFSSIAADPKTEDGWAFGVKDNTDRLWYAKRLNPEAVLVVSFYSQELKSAFEYPDDLQGMVVRLVGPDDLILHSSDTAEVGKALDSGSAALLDRVGDADSLSAQDSDQILASDRLSNGWRVLSCYPLASFHRHSRETTRVFTLIALIVSVSFMIVVLLLWRQLSKPVDSMVRSLNEQASRDQLSGLLNKITYETLAAESLRNAGKNVTGTAGSRLCMYMLMDIDNFKQVNDSLGHSQGDRVIAVCGTALLQTFGQIAVVGRVGGDEFSAFRILEKGADPSQISDELKEESSRFRSLLQEELSGPEWRKVPVTVSMGIALVRSGDSDFQDMYRKADRALYNVKNYGKDGLRILFPDKEASDAENEDR